jgi:hypothetical protein
MPRTPGSLVNIRCPRCNRLIDRLVPLPVIHSTVRQAKMRAEPCGHVLRRDGTDISVPQEVKK